MIFLGIFTDSMEDDCLVLGVAKEKSLAGRLEHSNCSILKSTISSLTRCKSSFLFGLFTIFHWIIKSLILSWRCSLLVFSKFIVFISSLWILSRSGRLCCYIKWLIIAKTLLPGMVRSFLLEQRRKLLKGK